MTKEKWTVEIVTGDEVGRVQVLLRYVAKSLQTGCMDGNVKCGDDTVSWKNEVVEKVDRKIDVSPPNIAKNESPTGKPIEVSGLDAPELKRITDEEVGCACDWRGIVEDTGSSVHGELICPECQSIVQPDCEKGYGKPTAETDNLK